MTATGTKPKKSLPSGKGPYMMYSLQSDGFTQM